MGTTLLTELWFHRNGEQTFASVQIDSDRPEQKSASTRGGHDNNVSTHGCFHKADLHIVWSYLSDVRRLPVLLDYPDKFFLSSSNLGTHQLHSLSDFRQTANAASGGKPHYSWATIGGGEFLFPASFSVCCSPFTVWLFTARCENGVGVERPRLPSQVASLHAVNS